MEEYPSRSIGGRWLAQLHPGRCAPCSLPVDRCRCGGALPHATRYDLAQSRTIRLVHGHKLLGSAGVFCCVPSGLPAGLPQQVLDITTGALYPSTKLVPCPVLLGVTALLLNFHSMTNGLDGLDLAPLGSSLTRLDLSGTVQL